MAFGWSLALSSVPDYAAEKEQKVSYAAGF
jgi:hypothetical protein